MNSLTENPFAVLTLIAAPAVFTNASSVLALGTSNRLARAVDRARELGAQIRSEKAEAFGSANPKLSYLDRAENRAQLLVKAMTYFYAAIGMFAAASLVSVLGAVLATSNFHLAFDLVSALSVAFGTLGFIALVSGCSLLVRETHIAIVSLREESASIREQLEKR